MKKTATQLMAELKKDKNYLEMKKREEDRLDKLKVVYENDQKKMISDINKMGFDINSVWDFVSSDNNYHAAIPILIENLEMKHHPKITSGIVRALAIPELSEDQRLWDKLIDLYYKTPSDDEINIPEERGLRESILVSLDVFSKNNEEKIKIVNEMIRDHKN